MILEKTYKTVRRALEAYCSDNPDLTAFDYVSLGIVAKDNYRLEFEVGDAHDYVDACPFTSFSDVLRCLANFEEWFSIEWVDCELGINVNGRYVDEETLHEILEDYGWDAFIY